MLMSYEQFKRKLDEKIKTDNDFYYESKIHRDIQVFSD